MELNAASFVVKSIGLYLVWVRIDLKLDWLKQHKIQAQIEVKRNEAIFERSPGKDNKQKRWQGYSEIEIWAKMGTENPKQRWRYKIKQD